ncbi:rho-related GTP-binding protein RhoD [Hemicordylus capensis]|uniref:rho-related GTP-binding protein RhoD n=1 Tax=Hemicordylus capensis TaxID=884348 RepID=UPI002302FFD1|nr:rho-related GTP-binding protein RhoD [Hemicordylus capensis]XP_053143445.1 rho-related GTP-binding protein RhoD [Hemicordylus capensis]XP_053143446.1 rho-related GTP-binding protein RhoD [Hemicordylus capensis]
MGSNKETQGITEIKVVVVGDGGCGKTSLLMVFAKGEFPKVYIPTVFEKYSAPFHISGKHVQINLWDTAGQEDYDRLRPLSYSGAHAILMCYDVTNPPSFDNILTKWYPEARHFCRGVPILLVGCKTDLRKDKVLLRKLHRDQMEPITYQKGETLARNLHAVAYLECSARFQENITDIFIEASRAALSVMKKNQQRRKPRRTCLLS